MAAWTFTPSLKRLQQVEMVVRIGIMYPGHSYKEMQSALGCCKSRIERVARKNGFKKGLGYVNTGCYVEGSIPPNKGKKMSSVHPKQKAAQFRKGHSPKNKLPLGAITFRSGKGKAKNIGWFIKTALPNVWKPLAHHIWQQHNPPLAPGHVLRFIDGNINNCSIENLEVITQRENRIRNSATTLLSDRWVAFTIATKKNSELTDTLVSEFPELIQIKRLQITLNRQINGH